MKIFFYYSTDKFLNTYLIGNDNTKEAVFIDPMKITIEMIDNIARHKYKLRSVLFTHTDKKLQKEGLHTILKIYNPDIISVHRDLKIDKSIFIQGDGFFETAGFRVKYFAVPGLSAGSYMFQIENVIFSGGAISAGEIGSTSNIYAKKNLQKHLIDKVFNQSKDIIIMPDHGPPTSIWVESLYNDDMQTDFLSLRNPIFSI